MYYNKSETNLITNGKLYIKFCKKNSDYDNKFMFLKHSYLYVLYNISQILLLSKCTKYLVLSMRVLGSILGMHADRCANSPSPGPGGLLQEEEEQHHGDQAQKKENHKIKNKQSGMQKTKNVKKYQGHRVCRANDKALTA